MLTINRITHFLHTPLLHDKPQLSRYSTPCFLILSTVAAYTAARCFNLVPLHQRAIHWLDNGAIGAFIFILVFPIRFNVYRGEEPSQRQPTTNFTPLSAPTYSKEPFQELKSKFQALNLPKSCELALDSDRHAGLRLANIDDTTCQAVLNTMLPLGVKHVWIDLTGLSSQALLPLCNQELNYLSLTNGNATHLAKLTGLKVDTLALSSYNNSSLKHSYFSQGNHANTVCYT
jgi:hypothetical protein